MDWSVNNAFKTYKGTRCFSFVQAHLTGFFILRKLDETVSLSPCGVICLLYFEQCSLEVLMM